MKHKVYVDLDGVLVDLFSEMAKMSPSPITHWKQLSQTEIGQMFTEIKGTYFFRDLPKYPQTNTLLQSILNIAGSFSILSSPLAGDEEHCEKMKRLWVKENIPMDVEEVIITHDKTKYAKGNILIDDYHVNIAKWEAAGGFGIKFQANEQPLSDVLVPLLTLFKKAY
jgi:5'(3')-deoxyribonucleotidase